MNETKRHIVEHLLVGSRTEKATVAYDLAQVTVLHCPHPENIAMCRILTYFIFYLFIQYLKRNTQLATIASLPCGPL